MYGENQLKWDNVSDFVALTAVWTSTRNKLVPTLATFTATVQKGLKAFPLYDCKTWTLVDQKKKEITAYDFIQSCDIEEATSFTGLKCDIQKLFSVC